MTIYDDSLDVPGHPHLSGDSRINGTFNFNDMAIADINEQNLLLKRLKKIKPKLSRISGVTHVAVGYKFKEGVTTNQLAYIVYVGKKFDKKILRDEHQLPLAIGRVPVDVIEIQPRFHADDMPRVDPLVAGISVANTRFSTWGTLGCYVHDGGLLAGLTNYHVIVRNNGPFSKKGKIGDRINQPGLQPDIPENNIGTLLRFDENSDCAIFSLNESRTVNAAETLPAIVGPIGQPVEPIVGTLVKKVGAATNLTFGLITAVSQAGFTVGYNRDKMPPDDILSMEGDSGSVWLTDDADNNIVGLHFGGDIRHAFASRISLVLERLAVAIT